MNPFSSLLKGSFRLFKAQKYFLNTLGWSKSVKNLRGAISPKNEHSRSS